MQVYGIKGTERILREYRIERTFEIATPTLFADERTKAQSLNYFPKVM